MSPRARLRIRLALAAALSAALLVPTSAGAERVLSVSGEGSTTPSPQTASVGAQAIDDDIPGVALGASPVSGSLNYTSDPNDVYAITLEAGETLSARVIGGSGNDIDLYLYSPGSSGVYSDADRIVAAAEAERVYPDPMYDQFRRHYVATESGTYYLNVALIDASTTSSAQSYTLEWAKGVNVPVVTTAPSASVVGYRGTVRFTGSVLGAGSVPMGGGRVELWAWPYPYRTFVRRASAWTGADGKYALSTTVDRATRYTVVAVPNVPDHAYGESTVKLVKARPSLGAPRVKSGTKYRGKPFTVYGYLRPKHASGSKHVKVTAYRSDAGVWKVATNYHYNSATTRYTTKITLPYKGRWKLVATTPDDGEHAAATSAATYVTVR